MLHVFPSVSALPSTEPSPAATTPGAALAGRLSERSCPGVEESGILLHPLLWHMTSGTRPRPQDVVVSDNVSSSTFSFLSPSLGFVTAPVSSPPHSCIFVFHSYIRRCCIRRVILFIRDTSEKLPSHPWWRTLGPSSCLIISWLGVGPYAVSNATECLWRRWIVEHDKQLISHCGWVILHLMMSWQSGSIFPPWESMFFIELRFFN